MKICFDTHCHFENAEPSSFAAVLERARAAGVSTLMAVGGSSALNESAKAVRSYACEHVDTCPRCLCALGYDRDQAILDLPPIPEDAVLSAWGEIGLDYHYSPETRKEQLSHFAAQLEEARNRNLPVVIHTREADGDTLGILREIPSRGVIHCFTGTPPFARQLLDLGFYVSFSGIVTFRAADNVRESALYVPDDRILIETDSPFLAPVPKRGQANEPAFIVHTCDFLAELRKTPPDVFAASTSANASAMLGLDG